MNAVCGGASYETLLPSFIVGQHAASTDYKTKKEAISSLRLPLSFILAVD